MTNNYGLTLKFVEGDALLGLHWLLVDLWRSTVNSHQGVDKKFPIGIGRNSKTHWRKNKIVVQKYQKYNIGKLSSIIKTVIQNLNSHQYQSKFFFFQSKMCSNIMVHHISFQVIRPKSISLSKYKSLKPQAYKSLLSSPMDKQDHSTFEVFEVIEESPSDITITLPRRDVLQNSQCILVKKFNNFITVGK